MSDSFDIKAVVRGDIAVTPVEHPDSRAVRMKTEARRDLIHDCKEVAVFIMLLTAIVAVGGIGAYEGIWDPAASPDAKRWGQTILSAVMAGGISFVAGRKIGSK